VTFGFAPNRQRSRLAHIAQRKDRFYVVAYARMS
jgi:hypothetical protein